MKQQISLTIVITYCLTIPKYSIRCITQNTCCYHIVLAITQKTTKINLIVENITNYKIHVVIILSSRVISPPSSTIIGHASSLIEPTIGSKFLLTISLTLSSTSDFKFESLNFWFLLLDLHMWLLLRH